MGFILYIGPILVIGKGWGVHNGECSETELVHREDNIAFGLTVNRVQKHQETELRF